MPAALADGGAQVAQLVEQRTENPRVGGSIPPLGTRTFYPKSVRGSVPVCLPHVHAMTHDGEQCTGAYG